MGVKVAVAPGRLTAPPTVSRGLRKVKVAEVTVEARTPSEKVALRGAVRETPAVPLAGVADTPLGGVLSTGAGVLPPPPPQALSAASHGSTDITANPRVLVMVFLP